MSKWAGLHDMQEGPVRRVWSRMQAYAVTGGHGSPSPQELAAVAGGVAVATLLVLLVLRPPMVQRKATDDFRAPKVSCAALALWCGLAGLAAGALRWYGN